MCGAEAGGRGGTDLCCSCSRAGRKQHLELDGDVGGGQEQAAGLAAGAELEAQGTWGTQADASRERQRRAQGTAQPGPSRSAGCHQHESSSLHITECLFAVGNRSPRSPPLYLPPINAIYCTVNPHGRQPPWPGLSPPGFLCSQTSAPGREQLGPGFFEMQCCEGLDLRTKSCLGRKQTGLCKRPFLALVAVALYSSCTANNTGEDALPLITSQRPSAPLLFPSHVFAPAVPARGKGT